MVTFETHPSRYRHWTLDTSGRVATLILRVDEGAGLAPGYRLKLNSLDLGVDIELADALQRIRFEHPAVGAVVVTSGHGRAFCAGANIPMLAASTLPGLMDFCRFTNEIRNDVEDMSRRSGIRFLAAVNGSAAGGGYELALACDEILMVDDGESTVSLPEVPLLGIVPGTGGLTRLVDKRRLRRDVADLFCTTAEGVRAGRALEWGLVDAVARPSRFAQAVRERALALAATSDRPERADPVALPPLDREVSAGRIAYPWVEVAIVEERRVATITVRGPDPGQPGDTDAILARGAAWWPLAVARELDDALLTLRTNWPAVGTLVLRTRGSAEAVLAVDRALAAHGDHWFVRETTAMLRRCLSRLDHCARSIIAEIDEGSCFAGTLLELALAADRTLMIDAGATVALSALNFAGLENSAGITRLAGRLGPDAVTADLAGRLLDARDASELGLVTVVLAPARWREAADAVVLRRSVLSPAALTALEANLRAAGPETPATKIFGRLLSWQLWIFQRPNAGGPRGALRLYGSGERPRFAWERA